MTLTLADFLPVWGFLAANVITPGPNVLTTIALSMGAGRRAGMGSATGVGLGIAGWCLGMTLGAAVLLRILPGLQTLLTLAAILLLGWFAFRYFRAAWRGFQDRRGSLPATPENAGFATGFRRALLVNALNPKALTSWLAILGLFPVARASLGDVLILCAGASALSFAIHSCYVLAFSTPAALRAYLRAGWALQALAGALFSAFLLRLVAEII